MWIKATPERTFWFVSAIIALGLLFVVVQYVYRIRVRRRENRAFAKHLELAGLLAKPEESVLRDLIQRYKVKPASQILSGLAQFDAIASEEIFRLEKLPMPLAERMDRIEYLYAIRMQAFGKDAALCGAEAILRDEEPMSLPTPPEPAVKPLDLPQEEVDGSDELAPLLKIADLVPKEPPGETP